MIFKAILLTWVTIRGIDSLPIPITISSHFQRQRFFFLKKKYIVKILDIKGFLDIKRSLMMRCNSEIV